MLDCDQVVTNSSSLQRIQAHFERVLDGDLPHAYTPATLHNLTPAASEDV